MDNMKEQADVWESLATIKVERKIEENAGYSDQIFYQHLCEGIQENDLDKLYEVIDAIERGCGLPRNEKIDGLITEAYKENPFRLGEIIADRNSLIDYWVFLFYCTPEIICELIAIETEFTLFYYECARLLLQAIKDNSEYRTYIVKAVKKIAINDCGLWKRWIDKNEYNIEWQKLVGEVLVELPEDSLIAYANTIHLDMENQRNELKIITETFGRIPNNRIDYVLSVISKDICLRWERCIQKRKEQKKFQPGIMIFAYTNIILWSMAIFMREKNIWEKEFIANAEVLEKDMYEWFENQSQMISIFFIDMTQIFYLLYLKRETLSDIKVEMVFNAAYKIRKLIKQLGVFWNGNDAHKIEIEFLLNLIMK